MRRLPGRLFAGPVPAPSGPIPVEAYLRLGRGGSVADVLEPRLELFVDQLSAELSGCRWCIEAGRHRWRKALLPLEWLPFLRVPNGATCFSEREQAALAFAAAVACAGDGDGFVPTPVAAAARRHFPEPAIVRLTVLAAGEHFREGGSS